MGVRCPPNRRPSSSASDIREGLRDRVAIVTSAATGIGKAIAARLAGEGAAVVVNHLDQEPQARAVVNAIDADGGTALARSADVSRREQVQDLFDAAERQFGPPDILVNNADVANLTPIAEATEAEIDRVMSVNVKGVRYGCELAAQRMTSGGRIINISSATTGLALTGNGNYDVTKDALEQLTRVLAQETGSQGLTVNMVALGPTESDVCRAGKDPELLRSLEHKSGFGRLSWPSEIPDVVAYVASDKAGCITGEIIRVNGGIWAWATRWSVAVDRKVPSHRADRLP